MAENLQHGTMTSEEIKVGLTKAVKTLENIIQHMESMHGVGYYVIRDSDGNYVVSPILTAIIQGYVALGNQK